VGRDPLGMGQPPQTRSAMVLLYAYAAGNPAGLVDPMGLAACCPGDPGCPPDCKVGDTCFTEDTVVPEPPAPPPPEPEPKPTPPAPEPELEPKIYFAGTLVGTLPRSLLFPQWRAVARGNAIAVAIGIASVLVSSDSSRDRGKWTCLARSFVLQIPSALPEHVCPLADLRIDGPSVSAPTEASACAGAKAAFNDLMVRGCKPKHVQCICNKR